MFCFFVLVFPNSVSPLNLNFSQLIVTVSSFPAVGGNSLRQHRRLDLPNFLSYLETTQCFTKKLGPFENYMADQTFGFALQTVYTTYWCRTLAHSNANNNIHPHKLRTHVRSLNVNAYFDHLKIHRRYHLTDLITLISLNSEPSQTVIGR